MKENKIIINGHEIIRMKDGIAIIPMEGYKEKTADELFEELGYEKDIGEAFGVIRYKHKKEDWYIRFYPDEKNFDCNKVIDNEIYPLEIDKKMLKAICRKFEEEKWL